MGIVGGLLFVSGVVYIDIGFRIYVGLFRFLGCVDHWLYGVYLCVGVGVLEKRIKV